MGRTSRRIQRAKQADGSNGQKKQTDPADKTESVPAQTQNWTGTFMTAHLRRHIYNGTFAEEESENRMRADI